MALVLVGLLVALTARVVAAQAPTDELKAPAIAALSEAKRLFKQGNALRKAGDCERALEYYLRSRALLPSVANTLNAAVCLRQLARYDEALELCETLLTELGGQLRDERRTIVAREMASLRREVGGIDVQANVQGRLIVDGRPRGLLPRVNPLRVLPGTHRVVVLEDGYESFSRVVTVKIGQVIPIEVTLKRLVDAGRLRIEAPANQGAAVFIDETKVGTAPWEGNLEPGPHVFRVSGAVRGSAPASVTVLPGRTVTVRAESQPLGAPITLLVQPPTASIAIDAVGVGVGRFQGRLPLGRHRLSAAEPGYRTRRQVLVVTRAPTPALKIRLRVDHGHPRWDTRVSGTFGLELYGGPSFAPRLGSDAEKACAAGACSAQPWALGMMAGLRGNYEFPSRLSLSLDGGYWMMRRRTSRTMASQFVESDESVSVQYALDDDTRVAGPYVAVGLAYRHPIAGPIELRNRVTVGALFATSRNFVSGTATANGETVPVALLGADQSLSAVAIFVTPELGMAARFGAWAIGLDFGLAFFLRSGPAYQTGDLAVVGAVCDGANAPTGVACAPRSAAISEERAPGVFVAMQPRLSIAHPF